MVRSMPALSKPNSPYCGFGAGNTNGTGGETSTKTGGGGISAVRAAQPASIVDAARNAKTRTIVKPPSIDAGAAFLRSAPAPDPLLPFACDPPAPCDERHPISCERNDGADDRQTGNHGGRGIGE